MHVIRGCLIVYRATLLRAVRSCARGEAIFRINAFTEYKRSGLSITRKLNLANVDGGWQKINEMKLSQLSKLARGVFVRWWEGHRPHIPPKSKRANLPFAVPHPGGFFLPLYCCEKLLIASWRIHEIGTNVQLAGHHKRSVLGQTLG